MIPVFYPPTDNTELIKSLLKSFNNLDGSPLNMETLCEFERILRTLEQYVTIIQIHNNKVCTVDVDASIELLKRRLIW